ncbi:MAG: hypothetical protein J6R42_05490 [Clostridia bacterium]|nr:hypothetical protein [Clostridia bacterium]
MRIDRATLNALLALDDVTLWGKIVALGESKGFALPKTPPPPAEMQKLREVLRNPERFDMATALKIINDHRKNNRHG